eukprot:3597497-Rhodomonas_salina.1
MLHLPLRLRCCGRWRARGGGYARRGGQQRGRKTRQRTIQARASCRPHCGSGIPNWVCTSALGFRTGSRRALWDSELGVSERKPKCMSRWSASANRPVATRR